MAQARQDSEPARLAPRGGQVAELFLQQDESLALREAPPQCPNSPREDVLDRFGNEVDRQARGPGAFHESESSRRSWWRSVSPGNLNVAPEPPDDDFREQSSFAARRDRVAAGPFGIYSGGLKVPLATVLQRQRGVRFGQRLPGELGCIPDRRPLFVE